MRSSGSSRIRQQTAPLRLHNPSTNLSNNSITHHAPLKTSHISKAAIPLSQNVTSLSTSFRPLSDMPRGQKRQHVHDILNARQDLTDLEEELYYTQRDIDRIRSQRGQRSSGVQTQHPEDHLTQHQTAAMSSPPSRSSTFQQRNAPVTDTWGTGRHLSQFNDDILPKKILNRQNGTPDPDNERGGYQIAEGVQTNDELHIPMVNLKQRQRQDMKYQQQQQRFQNQQQQFQQQYMDQQQQHTQQPQGSQQQQHQQHSKQHIQHQQPQQQQQLQQQPQQQQQQQFNQQEQQYQRSTQTPRQDMNQLLPAVVDAPHQQVSSTQRRKEEHVPSLSEIARSFLDHDIRRPVPPPYAVQPRVVHGADQTGYRAHGRSSMHSDSDTSLFLMDTSDEEDRSGIRNSMKYEEQGGKHRDQSNIPRLQPVSYDRQRRIQLGGDSRMGQSPSQKGYRQPERLQQSSQVPLRQQWVDKSYGPGTVPLPVRGRSYTDSDDDLTEISQRILKLSENRQARLFQRALERRYGNEPPRSETLRWKNTSPVGADPDLQRESDDMMLNELEQDRYRRLVHGMSGKYREDLEHESRFHFDSPGEFYKKPELMENYREETPHYTYRTQQEIMSNPILRDEYVKGINRQVKGQSDTRRWGIRRFSTSPRSRNNKDRRDDDDNDDDNNKQNVNKTRNNDMNERSNQENVPQANERHPSDGYQHYQASTTKAAEARGNLHHESVYRDHRPYDFVPVEESLSGRSPDNHRSRTTDFDESRADLH